MTKKPQESDNNSDFDVIAPNVSQEHPAPISKKAERSARQVDTLKQVNAKRWDAARAAKQKFHLNQQQYDVLIGCMLSDATMKWMSGLNSEVESCIVKFEHQHKHKAYVDFLYELFKPFIGSPPRIRYKYRTKDPHSYHVATLTHPDFVPIYKMFYHTVEGKRVKKVPDNIETLLTPLALAHFFMGDGSFNRVKKSNKGEPPVYRMASYNLNTHSFTQEENERLCEVLLKKYNINCTIQQDGSKEGSPMWRIYIGASEKRKFVSVIRPHLHPVFLYKVDLDELE